MPRKSFALKGLKSSEDKNCSVERFYLSFKAYFCEPTIVFVLIWLMLHLLYLTSLLLTIDYWLLWACWQVFTNCFLFLWNRGTAKQSWRDRSSRPEVFCKKGVFENFTKFTRKHLCQSLFFNKLTLLITAYMQSRQSKETKDGKVSFEVFRKKTRVT